MDIFSTIISVVAIFNISLATIVFFNGPRKKAEFSYAAVVFSIVIWAVSTMFFLEVRGFFVSFYALAASHFAVAFMAVGFWFFANEFNPAGIFRFYRTLSVIFVAAGIIFSGFVFLSSYVIDTINLFGDGLKTVESGRFHVFYIIYIAAVIGFSLIKLFMDFRFVADAEKKNQISVIMFGAIATALTEIWFSLAMLGKEDFYFAAYGPISTFIMVGCLSYVLIRKNSLRAKIIASEIFTISVVVILFSRLTVPQNSADFVFNGFLFVFSIVFGYLLTRSVAKEVDNREKISALADELAKSNEELKRLDEAKSEFISIASHQMRSPLTAVKGYISILLEGTFGRLTAGQIEALHKIFVSTEHLIKLIDDLLNLSQIESGRMRYDFKKINLLDIAKEVVEEQQPNVEKKKLRIIITEPPFVIPPVFADSDKMRQIILNLIDNSIRYTDKGGAEIRFYKKEVGGKEYLGMVIEDSGRGIEKDDIGHLFAKFVRAERTRKLYTEGSGLGLYVAKRIVDDHNGRIYAESDGAGKGSSFFVELPIA